MRLNPWRIFGALWLIGASFLIWVNVYRAHWSGEALLFGAVVQAWLLLICVLLIIVAAGSTRPARREGDPISRAMEEQQRRELDGFIEREARR